MIEDLVESEQEKKASRLLCLIEPCYIQKFKNIADCLATMNVNPVFFTKAYGSLNSERFGYVLETSGNDYDAFLVQWIYKKLGETAKTSYPNKKVVWFTDTIFENEPAYSAKTIAHKISYDVRSYKESPATKNFAGNPLAKAVH